MVKKIFAAILCAVMVISLIPFTVSAAESASFKLCVASQDSKSVTITLDFADGTGFSAFDASLKYNNLKLSLEECQFASGFAAFKNYVDEKGGMTIFNANSTDNPVKISIATTVPFKKINSDGAIIKIRFSKIEGANVAQSDFSLTIDNCQNGNFEDINASVSYDLTTGSSSSANNATIDGGKLPEEGNVIHNESELKTEPANSEEATDAQAVSSADSGNTAEESGAVTAETAKAADKGLSNSKKTVVIILIALVLAGGIAALAAIIMKNKKSPAEYDD